MEPGVDYGSNHYPLEGSEDVAPRNQPLREQEQSLQDVVVDVEGLEPEEPETTRPSSSRFCPGCGFKAGDGTYCDGCGKVVDVDGINECDSCESNQANFTCGFHKGRMIEETRALTCRKKLCGEHVKLVFNKNAEDKENQQVDMCDTCKTGFEAVPETDLARRRRRNNYWTIGCIVVVVIVIIVVIAVVPHGDGDGTVDGGGGVFFVGGGGGVVGDEE